ncbi:MAG: hypothetical protein ACRCXD_03010 [Luteolibacter sp.]
MKNTDKKPDWSRARDLLAGMRSHARRRLTSQILLGKELLELKTRLGYIGANARRGPERQFVSPGKKTWKQWCLDELKISWKTADRYIVRFEKAAEFARTLPQAGNILFAPTAELSGDEIDTLSEFVEQLVDDMTAASLRIELGLTVEKDDEDEGPTNQEPGSRDLKIDLPQEAQIFFASIVEKIDKFRKSICGSREYRNYKAFLEHLPLDDGRVGKPSLIGIKEGLEDALKQGFSGMMEDLGDVIKSRMADAPQKQVRRKRLTKKR